MGRNGDQGEEMQFTHDPASGWSAWARQRAAEEETAVIEAVISIGSRPRRHQAHHDHAGESVSQAVGQKEGQDESESSPHPHHDPHTHTTGPVPSDPLFALCEFRVDC